VSVVLNERVSIRNGIAFADDTQSPYRARWEHEAESDHVLSAVATSGAAPDDVAALTAKLTEIWDRFPDGHHVGTLIDIGTGYGRIPLHLSRARGLTCDIFCGIDISETMLRRLLEYRTRFDVFPGAEVHAICASADQLPLATGSVDLAVSSAVFLHMGKSYVRRALAEVARVLRPGGAFVFESSFPNPYNPLNIPSRLKPRPLRNPNAMKYWRRHEVEQLFRDSGLEERIGPTRVEPTRFAVLPKNLGPLRVPFARRANEAIADPTHFRDFLAVTYTVYSESAFT
jgi:arsenite methyltransferase